MDKISTGTLDFALLNSINIGITDDMEKIRQSLLGSVVLVGAGAGDISLLSLGAYKALKLATTIVYDRLVGEEILNINTEAKKICVGKRRKGGVNQAEINSILLEEARKNEFVVRLKGGDGYVFGRGAEEAIFLGENNIRYSVIAGLSSVIAGLSAAGIPLTHRGLAHSFRVISGTLIHGNAIEEAELENLKNPYETLVFVMGMENLEYIVENIIKSRAKSTPIAIIENATKASQRVLVGKLENIVIKVKELGLKPPALIVIGEVVKLREKLWKLK